MFVCLLGYLYLLAFCAATRIPTRKTLICFTLAIGSTARMEHPQQRGGVLLSSITLALPPFGPYGLLSPHACMERDAGHSKAMIRIDGLICGGRGIGLWFREPAPSPLGDIGDGHLPPPHGRRGWDLPLSVQFTRTPKKEGL